eukprot:767193-Hanusia_phi.AAC.7
MDSLIVLIEVCRSPAACRNLPISSKVVEETAPWATECSSADIPSSSRPCNLSKRPSSLSRVAEGSISIALPCVKSCKEAT